MRIITVNLPVEDLKIIRTLVGKDKLYLSRSELIRTAIRDFLVKELKIYKGFNDLKNEKPLKVTVEKEPKLDNRFVRIPIEKTVGMEKIKAYKTYKIIQK